jgi:hypothetical protein
MLGEAVAIQRGQRDDKKIHIVWRPLQRRLEGERFAKRSVCPLGFASGPVGHPFCMAGAFARSRGHPGTGRRLWNGNTAVGTDALNSLSTGISNTATGAQALYDTASGSFNTATGFEALRDNNGNNNTATGYWALMSNTRGHDA